MDPTVQVFREILDALVAELSKSKEGRDIPGIAGFLDSVVVSGNGATFLDRFAPLARTPEALARLSIKLIDPRLGSGSAWDGVRDLLVHVRGTETFREGK
jgi:hypothetical protein